MSDISESFPKPNASVDWYASFLWRTALHIGDTTYPDALDMSEPEDCKAMDETLAKMVDQPEFEVLKALRVVLASTLASAQYELGFPDLQRVEAGPIEVNTLHRYLSGPVAKHGKRQAIRQQFIPPKSETSNLQPFSSPELFDAVWCYRDDRREIVNLGMKDILGDIAETARLRQNTQLQQASSLEQN